MKSIVLLEGGSYRGIYTSGVLDVFMEHGLYPDCVVGTSAGALNGLGYVAKQPGRCRDIVMDYGMDPRYVGGKAMLREHNLIGFDFILRDLQKVLPFDSDTFWSPERKFYAVATNCRTAEAEFLDRDTCPDFLSAVAASASMQYLCKKVTIEGEQYLDGGIASRLGLEFLEAHPKYDRAVIILTRRLDYRKKKPSALVERLARRFYHKTPLLVEKLIHEDEIYATEREKLAELERQGKILVIQPQSELPIGKLERNLDNLKLGYETGQRDGERYLEQVRSVLEKPSPEIAI